MDKELLFSVTASDCRWDYFRSSGPGGQNVNKVNSGVRCTHELSKAVGKAIDSRSQHENKKLAFKRMANTKEFQSWVRLEAARKTGVMHRIDEEVRKQLRNIKVEVKLNDRWVEINKDDPLNEENENDED